MPSRLHSIPALMLGVAAVGLAVWWLPRCVQAERATLLYKEACYGPSSNDVFRVLSLAQESADIDPGNYHFWALAADDAWNARSPVRPVEEDARLRGASQLWCEKALAANPWHPKARVLWTGILAERDLPQALRYWQTCVEWQYWEPFNHAFLAELLGRSGDFAGASNVLERIRGRPYYQEARRILDGMAAPSQPRGRD